MKYILSVLLFLALSWTSSAVTKEMRRYELFCTFKVLQEGDTLFGSYIVSGYNEQGMALQLFSPGNNILHVIEREREGQFEVNATETGEYRACFRNLESDLAYVTFEWHALIGDNKAHKIGTHEIGHLGINLEGTVRAIKEVKRNLNYQKMRDSVHTENLDTLNSRISWSSFLKVLAIAGFGVGQFMILTNLFNKKYNRVSV